MPGTGTQDRDARGWGAGYSPAGHVERFRAVIAARLGLHFEEAKFGFLTDLLRQRAAAGEDIETYLARLESQPTQDDVRVLARELTVPETYFFRHFDQYRAYAEIALPDRLAARASVRRLRIASLGCASGEEAYSLAMLAHHPLNDPSWDVSIVGVDINPIVLDKARRGRYSTWALRETPDEQRLRWFRDDGRTFVLDDRLRAAVTFVERNLLDDDPRVWLPGMYDVIFCRNVLMYFAPEQAQRVVKRITDALDAGGYLFLGHAETLRGLSHDFHLRHTHNTFYYQCKAHADEATVAPPRTVDCRPVSAAPLATFTAETDTWVEAIRRASERVAALTATRDRPTSSITPDSRANTVAPGPIWDRGVVLELLREEQFAAALAMVEAWPAESNRDPDALLLRAVLLTHGGQLAKAEDACRRLLEVDELSAGAHYVLALCRESAGDRDAALYQDQVAAYLDPGFAMPRLHLGLLARRAGDHRTARRELGDALVLLQREDASRVLLFGGGFGRDALVALCQAELRRCGGKP